MAIATFTSVSGDMPGDSSSYLGRFTETALGEATKNRAYKTCCTEPGLTEVLHILYTQLTTCKTCKIHCIF
jgi:hypothetical protein